MDRRCPLKRGTDLVRTGQLTTKGVRSRGVFAFSVFGSRKTRLDENNLFRLNIYEME
jgi:hypothetical protein